MTVDWLNPSDDIVQARRIGYQEAKTEYEDLITEICEAAERAGRPEGESAIVSIEKLAEERDVYRERAIGLAANLRIEHPAHVMGSDRRCPITHKQFAACWTDNSLGGSCFQRCDSCSPHLVEPLADEIREHQKQEVK